MRGSLSEFAGKVNEKVKDVLSAYTPEVEFAIGPAKMTVRAVPNGKVMAKNLLTKETDENER